MSEWDLHEFLGCNLDGAEDNEADEAENCWIVWVALLDSCVETVVKCLTGKMPRLSGSKTSTLTNAGRSWN